MLDQKNQNTIFGESAQYIQDSIYKVRFSEMSLDPFKFPKISKFLIIANVICKHDWVLNLVQAEDNLIVS